MLSEWRATYIHTPNIYTQTKQAIHKHSQTEHISSRHALHPILCKFFHRVRKVSRLFGWFSVFFLAILAARVHFPTNNNNKSNNNNAFALLQPRHSRRIRLKIKTYDSSRNISSISSRERKSVGRCCADTAAGWRSEFGIQEV